MNKFTKTFLHVWLSVVSVLGFAFGWAFIAHAQKPAPLDVPQVQISAPTQNALEPIPTISDLVNNQVSPQIKIQNPSFTFPRLRTKGS